MSSERSALLHNKDKISVSQMTQTPPPSSGVSKQSVPPRKGATSGRLGAPQCSAGGWALELGWLHRCRGVTVPALPLSHAQGAAVPTTHPEMVPQCLQISPLPPPVTSQSCSLSVCLLRLVDSHNPFYPSPPVMLYFFSQHLY